VLNSVIEFSQRTGQLLAKVRGVPSGRFDVGRAVEGKHGRKGWEQSYPQLHLLKHLHVSRKLKSAGFGPAHRSRVESRLDTPAWDEFMAGVIEQRPIFTEVDQWGLECIRIGPARQSSWRAQAAALPLQSGQLRVPIIGLPTPRNAGPHRQGMRMSRAQ
jgi:hypothetical protein